MKQLPIILGVCFIIHFLFFVLQKVLFVTIPCIDTIIVTENIIYTLPIKISKYFDLLILPAMCFLVNLLYNHIVKKYSTNKTTTDDEIKDFNIRLSLIFGFESIFCIGFSLSYNKYGVCFPAFLGLMCVVFIPIHYWMEREFLLKEMNLVALSLCIYFFCFSGLINGIIAGVASALSCYAPMLISRVFIFLFNNTSMVQARSKSKPKS